MHLDFINYIHNHSSISPQDGNKCTVNIDSYTHIHIREYIWVLYITFISILFLHKSEAYAQKIFIHTHIYSGEVRSLIRAYQPLDQHLPAAWWVPISRLIITCQPVDQRSLTSTETSPCYLSMQVHRHDRPPWRKVFSLRLQQNM